MKNLKSQNMKIQKLLILVFFTLFLFSFSEDPLFNPSEYEAIIMYRSDLEKSVVLSDPIEIRRAGKIYYKDQFIFVTMRYKGIHVIDNRDPENPVNLKFIKVPGCQDVAIKQSVMYVDNATDLVAIELSELPNNIEVMHRVTKAFPNPLPPDLDYIPERFRSYNRPDNTVIIDWKKAN